jgi:hypothetical protein
MNRDDLNQSINEKLNNMNNMHDKYDINDIEKDHLI